MFMIIGVQPVLKLEKLKKGDSVYFKENSTPQGLLSVIIVK
jgi:Cu/Ag efflux protein CusF